MHNTRPHTYESKIFHEIFREILGEIFREFSVKTFNYSKNMRCVIVKKHKTHIALQFREGRDEGIQTKCFDFFFEGLWVKIFQIFL
jgi:hypothetical protein